MFANVFNFINNNEYNPNSIEIFSVFFQQTTIYLSFILLIFFFLTSLVVKADTTDDRFSSLLNFIRFFNILILTLIFILTVLKFFLYL